MKKQNFIYPSIRKWYVSLPIAGLCYLAGYILLVVFGRVNGVWQNVSSVSQAGILDTFLTAINIAGDILLIVGMVQLIKYVIKGYKNRDWKI